MTKNITRLQAGRATMQTMDALHGLVAGVLFDYLLRVKAGTAELQPALIGQVVKFLSANGVDSPARVAGLDRLLGQMPDFDALEADFKIIPSPTKENVPS